MWELDHRSLVVDDAVFPLPEVRTKFVELADMVQKHDVGLTLTEPLHEGECVPDSAIITNELHEPAVA